MYLNCVRVAQCYNSHLLVDEEFFIQVSVLATLWGWLNIKATKKCRW